MSPLMLPLFGDEQRTREGARTDGKSNYFKEQLIDHMRMHTDPASDDRSHGRPCRRHGFRNDDEYAQHDRQYRHAGGQQIECSRLGSAPSDFHDDRRRVQPRVGEEVEELLSWYRIRNGLRDFLVGTWWSCPDAGEVEHACIPFRHNGVAITYGARRFRSRPGCADGCNPKQNA